MAVPADAAASFVSGASPGHVSGASPGRFLRDRASATLAAAAIGDALGGATEGWSPAQIQQRWGGWVEGIVEHYYPDGWRTARPGSPFHKGDGHFTDDTIMTHLFAEVYVEQERHLTAYDIADHLVPKMLKQEIYIPELERRGVAIERVFLAERYPVLRLEYAHIDPREAGVGNMVNCGAAMYIPPTGIVNTADPDGAYAEAIDIAAAHQHSYGREAAGVLAALVAAAATPGASVDSVAAAGLRLAKDGTALAIEAALDAARSVSHWTEAIATGALRDAVRPFDTVAENYYEPSLAARLPSRLHAIEELPIALALVVIARGDVRESILGGVNYGRDADSIASMAGAISGALQGTAGVPVGWLDAITEASRTDLLRPGEQLGEAAVRIRARDLERSRHLALQTEKLIVS